MDLELSGKRAIVTGGSRGIGRAIARTLAAEGCAVAICARTREEVDAAVQELGAQGVRAWGDAVDVLDADAVRAFVDAAAEALGGLDLLVACAGGTAGSPRLDEFDAAAFRTTLDLNVTHPAAAAAAAAPHLREAGGGAMVFITSMAGGHPWTRPSYGAAKAAENHLAASLARELARDHIRVNAVSPGSIMFPGSAWEGVRDADVAAFDRWLEHELPLGRLGTDQEVADVTAFLLSSRASWVTGTTVDVDGGQAPPNARTTQPMRGAWG